MFCPETTTINGETTTWYPVPSIFDIPEYGGSFPLKGSYLPDYLREKLLPQNYDESTAPYDGRCAFRVWSKYLNVSVSVPKKFIADPTQSHADNMINTKFVLNFIEWRDLLRSCLKWSKDHPTTDSEYIKMCKSDPEFKKYFVDGPIEFENYLDLLDTMDCMAGDLENK